MTTEAALVEIYNLHKYFGGLSAVKAFNLNIYPGEIIGLIGPNGAGKTTLLNVIAGSLLPNKGKIIFNNSNITKLPPHERAKRGIGRIFQHDVFFNSFTVLENLEVGLLLHAGNKTSNEYTNERTHRQNRIHLREKALEILRFVSLEQNPDELAVNLPHGKQRLLSLAIALAIKPQLLLLDEPLTGMNAEEVNTMVNMIKIIRAEKGITNIVVEHNLKAVMGLCDRIAVLNFGEKLAEGIPGDVMKNEEVIQAYLGTEEDDV